MITIDYNLSRDYCSDWGALEALREIVQNALDSGNNYECTVHNNAIEVLSKGQELTPEVFSMGISRKSSNAIGKYGEGFKLAMLVLTRLELKPVIYTGNMVVTGSFKTHNFTGVETFCLHINNMSGAMPGSVKFLCKKPDIDYQELENKLTPFAEFPLPKVRNRLEVLDSKPGMIYVNGLFVCECKDLSKGYNFAPDYIELNRDRNMVNGIEHQLAKYYGSLGKDKASLVFNLVENEARDVAWLSWNISSSELRAELARLFYNKYGEGAEIKQTTGYYGGSSFGVTCGSSRYSTYSNCGIKETTKKVDPASPLGVLESFLADNKKQMRRDLRVRFEQLITQAKAWRK
ncbi:HATPase [Vibrio phage VPMS1]|uniref:HATPase n=1 Tax=Vibrio phage VPMS1 TaxID=1233488 RepID=UPI0003585445|nr:HATPase [Vibrio phage VPMS1]AFV51119.1 HATPase [Vibrio phage VPMS1]